MLVVTSMALTVLRSRKNTLDSGGKTKDAFPSPYFIFLCAVCLSALRPAMQNHCRQKIFQTAVIDKTLKNKQYIKYSECLTKEALEGFGDFKIGGQIIQTVKYADELVLLAK